MSTYFQIIQNYLLNPAKRISIEMERGIPFNLMASYMSLELSIMHQFVLVQVLSASLTMRHCEYPIGV